MRERHFRPACRSRRKSDHEGEDFQFGEYRPAFCVPARLRDWRCRVQSLVKPLYSLSILRAGRVQGNSLTEWAQRRSISTCSKDTAHGTSSSRHSLAIGTCFQKALKVSVRGALGIGSIARAMSKYLRYLAPERQ